MQLMSHQGLSDAAAQLLPSIRSDQINHSSDFVTKDHLRLKSQRNEKLADDVVGRTAQPGC